VGGRPAREEGEKLGPGCRPTAKWENVQFQRGGKEKKKENQQSCLGLEKDRHNLDFPPEGGEGKGKTPKRRRKKEEGGVVARNHESRSASERGVPSVAFKGGRTL